MPRYEESADLDPQEPQPTAVTGETEASLENLLARIDESLKKEKFRLRLRYTQFPTRPEPIRKSAYAIALEKSAHLRAAQINPRSCNRYGYGSSALQAAYLRRAAGLAAYHQEEVSPDHSEEVFSIWQQSAVKQAEQKARDAQLSAWMHEAEQFLHAQQSSQTAAAKIARLQEEIVQLRARTIISINFGNNWQAGDISIGDIASIITKLNRD